MLMLLACTGVHAYDFEKDGIYYNVTSLTDLTVEVTYENTNGTLTYAEDMEIPETVKWKDKTFQITAIGENAFAFANITSIKMPCTITAIERYSFRGCSFLKEIIFPKNLVRIADHVFENCTSLTSLTIPATVIAEYAFENCTSLSSITFTATEFNNDWGDLVIDDLTFNGCNQLKEITLYAENPPSLVQENAFPAIAYLDATLYVPKGCKNLYSTVPIWNHFSHIEETDYSNPASCTLSVSSIGNGSVSFLSNQVASNNTITKKVKKDSTIDFYINADYGYKLETIQINGTYVPITELVTSTSLTEILTQEYNTYEFIFSPIPVNLVIQQAESGTVKVEAEYGKARTVHIMPENGWHIHSVTLDGIDYTYALDSENSFTTPELYTDTYLNVAFEQDGDGVSSLSSSPVKVYAQNGRLVVEQVGTGSEIRIYDSAGRTVKTLDAQGGRTETALPTGQVYIVKTVGKTVKIAL